MKLKNILIPIIAFLLYSCNNSSQTNESLNLNTMLEEGDKNNIEISEESMRSIIESIPSPIEVAMVIRKTGTSFNESLLNDQNNAPLYTTDQSKAIAIGVYSGDLGYINMFGKALLTVNYLNTIKNLADEINIGQFFDFETIRRLASNSDKMDSLIFLSTLNFNKMDSYLREQHRNSMSILMVTGTWIEGLYIAVKNQGTETENETLDWIGNQKIIIDQLILGLNAFKSDPFFSKLLTDIQKLKEVYNGVTITYEYHEPESVEIDGRLVIVDKSTSKVNISKEQVSEIEKLVEEMRLRIIKNN